MRIKIIACKALFRELSFLAATSENTVDLTFLRQGLHDTPQLLKGALQKELNLLDTGQDLHSCAALPGKDWDVVILGYGFCGGALDGLYSKKYLLAAPRVHDCISLLLGGSAAYESELSAHPGTFYYTPSWIENAFVPSQENYEAGKKELSQKFGKDAASFALDPAQTLGHYNACAYLSLLQLPLPSFRAYTKKAAEYLGFSYRELSGRIDILQAMIDGRLDEDIFVLARPGEQLCATQGQDLLLARPKED